MPLRFKLRQLEYFVAVADAGTIVAASERINVAPPTISTALSQLEQEFGLSLFVRHHAHGLSLTPGGRRFLVAARATLESAANLHDVAGDIMEQVRGPVSVGCLVTVAPFLMAALRRQFQDAHPDVFFYQRETDQSSLIHMLRRADIDIAITYDMDIPQDITFEPLATLSPYALVAGDHPLAEKKSVTLKKLAKLPMILLDLPHSREYFLSLFEAADLRPQIGDRTPHLPMVQSLAANGLGYGLLNIPNLGPASPDGRPLRMIPIRESVRPLQLGLASMQPDRKTRTISSFEEHCREVVPAALRSG